MMNKKLNTAPLVHSPAAEEAVLVRKACMRDIPALLRLVNGYAVLGAMLPRTEFELAENVRDFTVVLLENRLAGCGALHFYGPLIGEIRSLAVVADQRKHGLGTTLCEALEREARENGVESLFAFTYVPSFFERLGFAEVDRGRLPAKVWKDCLHCPKFECCDEIAMMKTLDRDGATSPETRSEPEMTSAEDVDKHPVLLPKMKPPRSHT